MLLQQLHLETNRLNILSHINLLITSYISKLTKSKANNTNKKRSITYVLKDKTNKTSTNSFQ